MGNYRKIYEQHYGEIPRDKDGRKYEIHHIDGNHSNDSPENLKAVTIQEHYDIHYNCGDWAACLYMSKRMILSYEEISELASKAGKESNRKRLENGTHNLLKRPDGTSVSSDQVNNGTHPFQTRADNTNIQTDRVKAGTHHFLKRPDDTSVASDRVKDGTHHFVNNNPSKIPYHCNYCNKDIKGLGNFKMYHGDNCKLNT